MSKFGSILWSSAFLLKYWLFLYRLVVFCLSSHGWSCGFNPYSSHKGAQPDQKIAVICGATWLLILKQNRMPVGPQALFFEVSGVLWRDLALTDRAAGRSEAPALFLKLLKKWTKPTGLILVQKAWRVKYYERNTADTAFQKVHLQCTDFIFVNKHSSLVLSSL